MLRKLVCLAILLPWAALAQLSTAVYPSGILQPSQYTYVTNEEQFGSKTLASTITSTATVIPITSGAQSLNTPTVVVIGSEYVKISSQAGTNLNVWSSSLTVSNCTNASPIQVDFSTDHGLTGAERITITGVLGNTGCNVTQNAIAIVDSDSITLTGTTGTGAYSSGGAATATGRGFDGSDPASHTAGATLRAFLIGHHFHQLFREVFNIETLLGVNGDLVGELAEANTWAAKQTFTSTATDAAARVLCAALPSSPAAGDVACDSGASNAMKAYDGSTWNTLSAATSLGDPGGNGIVVRTALNTTTNRSLVQPGSGVTITNGDGVSGNPTFALANDLAALEALATTGMMARTASETYTMRTITAPAAGFTITNGDGVAGNPTFVLANDLAALEGLATTGIVARTASETYVPRTITGGTGITVTNGDGVSGAPDVAVTESDAFTWTGYHNFVGGSLRAPETTVASLPAAASNTGKIYVVTDGSDSSDCTTGSGSSAAICRSSGSAWVSIGGGGSTPGAHGSYYVSTPAATSITSGTPIKVAGTTTGIDSSNMTMSANNRLRYDGTDTQSFFCTASIGVTAGTNNTTYEFYFAKNTAIIASSEVDIEVSLAVEPDEIAFSTIISLATNDFIEVFVDDDGSTNMTASQLIVACSSVGATGSPAALEDTGANGVVVRTSPGTTSARTITAGNGVTVTNGNGVSGNPTIEVDRYFTKTTIGHADLTTASATEDEALFTAGQYEKICGVTIKHSTAFSGGTVSALTVSVGTSTTPALYATAFDIFQATGDTTFQDSLVWRSETMAAAGHGVIARFTATGDNVVNLTAGSVDIWVCRESIQ